MLEPQLTILQGGYLERPVWGVHYLPQHHIKQCNFERQMPIALS